MDDQQIYATIVDVAVPAQDAVATVREVLTADAPMPQLLRYAANGHPSVIVRLPEEAMVRFLKAWHDSETISADFHTEPPLDRKWMGR